MDIALCYGDGMRTWNTSLLETSSFYVTDSALDSWRSTQLQLLADDPSNPSMPKNPLSEWDAHREGCRVMRQIIAAKRASIDRATDRLLAKRTDALGDLYRRAPKTTRKAA